MFSNWDEGLMNQYWAAISGSMCYTIMGAATAWPSPTLTKMAHKDAPLRLDVDQISWMVSLMFLGQLVSPIPVGYLMEWFGRKKTCLCLSIIPVTSWLLILFADSALHLYIARFMVGLWIGTTTTVMPLYVGEISSTKIRTSLTTINNLLLNFGILFAYVIGPFVSYYTLAAACEVLTVVYICMFLPMPESPYFLIKQNHKEKALNALRWLRKGASEESIEKELNRIEQALEDQKNRRQGTLNDILFDKGNRKALVIAVAYALLKRLSGSGILQAYTSITLPSSSLGLLDPDSCVIVVGMISFLSSIASTALAVKYSRRVLLTISCGGCCLTTALIMVWFYLNDQTSVDVSGYSDVLFISIALYYSVFNIGLGPVGASIKGELFSPNVKGLSSSLTSLFVAVSAFFLNKYYLIIAQTLGMYVNYLIFTASLVFAIVFTWTYVPDTHNKTLEEIHEMLQGNKKPEKDPASL